VKLEATEISTGDTLIQSGGTEVVRNTRITTTSRGDGSGTINRLILGYGKERHFDGLKSMLALGAKVTILWGSMDYTQGPSTQKDKLTVTDEGTLITDTTSTYLDNRVFKSSGKANGLLLSLPVGLETKLSEKLTLRIGANTWIPLKFSGEWKKDTEDLPDTMADTAQVFTPAVIVPSGESVMSKLKAKILNMTTYYFGASYDITNNIRIDFLHFADLTRIDTWWMSLKLKY